MSKDYFIFGLFSDLQVGDVFKFSPIIDSDIPNRFFTAYQKDADITKINTTYGKELNRMEFPNDTQKEVMIYPNRRK